MAVKKRIYQELKNPDFPDLEFLYSKEVLDLAETVLEELLETERQEFEEKLLIPDEEITFGTFDDFSELSYFFGMLEHYQGVNNDEKIRVIIENFEPKYIDFGNEVAYCKRYYEMLQYCYKKTELDVQQKRVLEISIEAYEVRGIALPEDKQSELKEINKKLSELSQKFGNNVLDSQKQFSYIITDESAISEMPDDDKAVAEKKAQEQKQKGYLFDASGNAYVSVMKYCSDSQVRKYFYEARCSFATESERDNRVVILDILKQRNIKAKLLGFASYAELSLHFKMAETPDQILELFGSISGKAKQKALEEVQEIQEYFSISDLEAWDIGYYARKLKEEKYALDDKELKKYFEFETVLAGMFEIIKKLYDLDIKKTDTVSYHPEVEVYEVSRKGEFLSYFFTDYFYRPLKRHGAWANIFRENFKQNKKIVLNVANFQKGADGKTLLTLSDVETMFHEFGHATHEMLSRSQHSELSGFHVEWDFVELPSQLLENWCRHPEGLQVFAKHYESGEMIPKDMLDKLQKLQTFGTGTMIVKQNEYAMMDMSLHTANIPNSLVSLNNTIQQVHEQSSIFPQPDVYSPHTSFTHVFDGGYAAGYYSYMWAEVLEKDVWGTFIEQGDIFSPEIAEKLHDSILSQGTQKKASELFRDFQGRDVEIGAFLREKGL